MHLAVRRCRRARTSPFRRVPKRRTGYFATLTIRNTRTSRSRGARTSACPIATKSLRRRARASSFRCAPTSERRFFPTTALFVLALDEGSTSSVTARHLLNRIATSRPVAIRPKINAIAPLNSSHDPGAGWMNAGSGHWEDYFVHSRILRSQENRDLREHPVDDRFNLRAGRGIRVVRRRPPPFQKNLDLIFRSQLAKHLLDHSGEVWPVHFEAETEEMRGIHTERPCKRRDFLERHFVSETLRPAAADRLNLSARREL
jgi:hypothetical protein